MRRGWVEEWPPEGGEHHQGMSTTNSCSGCTVPVLYGNVPVGIGDLCSTCYWNEHTIHTSSVHEDVRRTYIGKGAPDPQDLFDAIIAYARTSGRATTLGIGSGTPSGPAEYKVELWVDTSDYNEGYEYMEDPFTWTWVGSKDEADEIRTWVAANYSYRGNVTGRKTNDTMYVKVHEAHPKHPVRSSEDTKLLFDHLASNWEGI